MDQQVELFHGNVSSYFFGVNRSSNMTQHNHVRPECLGTETVYFEHFLVNVWLFLHRMAQRTHPHRPQVGCRTTLWEPQRGAATTLLPRRRHGNISVSANRRHNLFPFLSTWLLAAFCLQTLSHTHIHACARTHSHTVALPGGECGVGGESFLSVPGRVGSHPTRARFSLPPFHSSFFPPLLSPCNLPVWQSKSKRASGSHRCVVAKWAAGSWRHARACTDQRTWRLPCDSAPGRGESPWYSTRRVFCWGVAWIAFQRELTNRVIPSSVSTCFLRNSAFLNPPPTYLLTGRVRRVTCKLDSGLFFSLPTISPEGSSYIWTFSRLCNSLSPLVFLQGEFRESWRIPWGCGDLRQLLTIEAIL